MLRSLRGTRHRFAFCIAFTALSALISSGASAFPEEKTAALPVNGRIVFGEGHIQTVGQTLTISQTSSRMIIEWESFDIGASAAVIIRQSDACCAVLIRTGRSGPSEIHGRLSAEGALFLVNRSGILFGPAAQVKATEFFASSQSITGAAFLSGETAFASSSGLSGFLWNAGRIEAAAGGRAVLIAPRIENEGVIETSSGPVLMVAGDSMRLTGEGRDILEFHPAPGKMDVWIENRGVIRADGGTVALKAAAVEEGRTATVINSGIIEAKALSNCAGRILLLSDRMRGEVIVGGTLDALDSEGTGGGFIETSAGKVSVKDNLRVATSVHGRTGGLWVIDPEDFTIASSGGDITGEGLSRALAQGSVRIETSASGRGGQGDIFVNDKITWGRNTLTLSAFRNIEINSDLSGSEEAMLILEYGQGSGDGIIEGTQAEYLIRAPINLPGGDTFQTRCGSERPAMDFRVVTHLGNPGSRTTEDLQGMLGDLSRHYALGADIDASATRNWHDGSGFEPVGGNESDYRVRDRFAGHFDGLGHTISGLHIGRQGRNFVGLFGAIEEGCVAHVCLEHPSIRGTVGVGALIGRAVKARIENVWSNGDVIGEHSVGGVVGVCIGSDMYSCTSGGSVSGTVEAGGLAGSAWEETHIEDCSSRGTVSGNGIVGGLVGKANDRSEIHGCSSVADVSLNGQSVERCAGGLAGEINSGTISGSHSKGNVTLSGLWGHGGGLVGAAVGSTIFSNWSTSAVVQNIDEKNSGALGGLAGVSADSCIENCWSVGNVLGKGYAGGLVGELLCSGISWSWSSSEVKGGNWTGGLVGYSGDSTIVSCWSNAHVEGDGGLGGLVGYFCKESGSEVRIGNSWSSGSVNGTAAIGGLVGILQESGVENSWSDASAGGSLFVGGLVGMISDGRIENSWCVGEVVGEDHFGGLVGGKYWGSGYVSRSFWDRETSGQATSALGTGKTTAEMKKLSTFVNAGWDIDDAGGTGKVWRIYGGYSYPLLRCFLPPITAAFTCQQKGSGSYAKIYDGTKCLPDGCVCSLSWADKPGGFDEGKILGEPIFMTEGKDVGLRSVVLGGLYSDQQGYDIKFQGNQTVEVLPRPITASCAVEDKVYDGTTTARVSGFLTGVVAGDDVGFKCTAAYFADRNMGTGKAATVWDLGLAGRDSGNYVLEETDVTAVADIVLKK
ncbi:YDG domain-containing protein [Desulfatiglans anilini]|uniref:two-partner secretion domain-containing protein n=1 Tax=Desulfatiglans anilini TaxID=90728 RepID=UPI0028F41F63|nr:YDG domain-containing protein [Desulfatiglans anilini]